MSHAAPPAPQQHPRIVDAATARALLPYDALIPAVRAMFGGAIDVPAREHHAIHQADGTEATLLIMPAWDAARFIGVKIVTVFPGNAARGAAALHSSYLLCDGQDGRHLALIDGNEITSRRTVAVSALAASFLARPEASRLLILGAGRVASQIAPAYRIVRPLTQVEVWDIDPAKAETLVDELRATGLDAAVSHDLESSVRAADMISAATLSRAPLIRGEWLKPGTHVDLIGAFTPAMRESDDETVHRARVFVDTPVALDEAGDLTQAIASGAFDASRLQGTLSDLCRMTPGSGRRSTDEITLFKAVGTAQADLAAGMLVHGQL